MPMEHNMSEVDVAYENLKRGVVKKCQGSLDLAKVKDHFASIIDSKRSLSRAKNLDDIIYLLEQRDVLDSQNVSALEHIVKISNNADAINLVHGYKKINFIDDYTVCICGEEQILSLPLLYPENENLVESDKTDSLEIAFINISYNIGKKWRVLASELKVPECYVDEVREKYPRDMQQQSLKILQIWKAYYDEAATLDNLKNTLESRICKMKGLGLHLLKPLVNV